MNDSGNENKSVDICEDCGAVVAEGKAGCLKLFEEVIAREFSDYRYGEVHRLTVDAYSLQHPERYMRSGKSFAAHLTGIYAALESEDAFAVNQKMRKWLNANPKIEKPVGLPRQKKKLAVTFIHSAPCADEHCVVNVLLVIFSLLIYRFFLWRSSQKLSENWSNIAFNLS